MGFLETSHQEPHWNLKSDLAPRSGGDLSGVCFFFKLGGALNIGWFVLLGPL